MIPGHIAASTGCLAPTCPLELLRRHGAIDECVFSRRNICKIFTFSHFSNSERQCCHHRKVSSHRTLPRCPVPSQRHPPSHQRSHCVQYTTPADSSRVRPITSHTEGRRRSLMRPPQYRDASGAGPNRWDQVGGVRQRPSTGRGPGRDLCSSCTQSGNQCPTRPQYVTPKTTRNAIKRV